MSNIFKLGPTHFSRGGNLGVVNAPPGYGSVSISRLSQGNFLTLQSIDSLAFLVVLKTFNITCYVQ